MTLRRLQAGGCLVLNKIIGGELSSIDSSEDQYEQ
jgi:hypothetical protein